MRLLFCVSMLVGTILSFATNCKGQLLVTSGSGNQILEYSVLGANLSPKIFGSLDSPAGIAVSNDGSVYVAAYNNHTVTKFNADGSGATIILSNVGNVDGMAFGPDGSLYLSRNTPVNDILKYDLVSKTSSVFVSGLNSPLDIKFNKLGQAFVADFGSGRILRYTSSGIYDGVFATGIGDGVGGPTGLAIDLNGNLFVSSFRTGKVQKYNSAGALLATLATLPRFGPEGLVIGPDGKLYVAETGDSGNGNDILRYNSDGSFDTTVVSSGQGGLGRPLFLAFRPNSEPSSVPEPGAFAVMAGVGVSGAFLYLRRRKRR